jgi:hypothetical protein
VGPRGRSVHGRSCSGAFTSDEAPAQRWAFEVDAMGAMDDAVDPTAAPPIMRDDLRQARRENLRIEGPLENALSWLAAVDDAGQRLPLGPGRRWGCGLRQWRIGYLLKGE